MANDIAMEKIFLDSISECGASKKTLARSTYVGFVTCDYSLYKNVEEESGPEMAAKMHRKTWFHNVPWVIKDVRESLGVWEITDLLTAAKFIKAMYDRISCPIVINTETPEKWIGTVPLSPMAEIALELFNEAYGSPYFKALAETLTAVNREFVAQLGLSDRIEVVCDSFICLGDQEDRIILKWIKGKEN